MPRQHLKEEAKALILKDFMDKHVEFTPFLHLLERSDRKHEFYKKLLSKLITKARGYTNRSS